MAWDMRCDMCNNCFALHNDKPETRSYMNMPTRGLHHFGT